MTRDKTQGGAPVPPRAEPLQPDRPGRGTDRDDPATGAGQASADEAKRLAEQEKTAVENVREGYGKR